MDFQNPSSRENMDLKKRLMAEYRDLMTSGAPIQPFIERLMDELREERVKSARRFEMLKTIEEYIGPRAWSALFGDNPKRM